MRLVVLDPGHFHAALLQKSMVPNVDATVHVYAEDGPELADYRQKIEAYNARRDNPTAWRTVVHAGPDFLERFSRERPGDVVVIAGNNRRKAEYITRAVETGMHVLADKPMAIDGAGFRVVARVVRPRRKEGRAALRHHDGAPRDHHDAAEGFLARARPCSASSCPAPSAIRPS